MKRFCVFVMMLGISAVAIAMPSFNSNCKTAGSSNEGMSYEIRNHMTVGTAGSTLTLSVGSNQLCCSQSQLQSGNSAICHLPLYANKTVNLTVNDNAGHSCVVKLTTRQPGFFSNPTTTADDSDCNNKFMVNAAGSGGGGMYRYGYIIRDYYSW